MVGLMRYYCVLKLTADSEAVERARQRHLRPHNIDASFLSISQPFLSPLSRRLRPLNINFLCPFGRLGENRDPLAPDLGKSSTNRHASLATALFGKR
jgi:hypothetical protein